MASDRTILTSFTELTTPNSTMIVPVVDVSDTTMASTGTNKKITYQNLTSSFATSSQLSSHTSNTSNPHATTAAQVGAYTTSQSDTNFEPKNSNIQAHISSTSNPHSVTKAQVGLTNVTDDAQLKRADGDINSFTEKTTPASNDVLIIEDSAASYAKKKVKVSNLPTGTSTATLDYTNVFLFMGA